MITVDFQDKTFRISEKLNVFLCGGGYPNIIDFARKHDWLFRLLH